MKYNELVVYSSDYFKMDNPAVRKRIEAYFDFLRGFHVEPIPTVWLNPDMAELEGVQLIDEPVRFSGDTCRFGFQRLVDLASSRPRLHSQPGGGRTFIEGTDYKILSLQPPLLQRLASGLIPQDQPVYLDADLVDLRTHRFAKACPSEEKVYEKFQQDIERVIKLLRPQKIHVNHDEIGVVNSDSRCRKRGLNDYELVAYQINRMRDIIKAADAGIDMIMWADAVNPYHNAGKKNLEKTCELVHRDIIMAHWFYDAEDFTQVDLLEMGAQFFIDKGFRMYGCPWDDLVNHQAWEKVLAQYRTEPQLYGLMHTQWGDRTEGIAQTGASNWEEKTWLRK